MSKCILVVEDQEDNRQIIRDMLSATDYEVIEAESGEAALAVVAIKRPDLILMESRVCAARACVYSKEPLKTVGQSRKYP
jgi:CheY-like chemotaxis protein